MAKDFGETKVPLDWSSGKEETVDEWGERQYVYGRKTGLKSGVAIAANYVLQKAKDDFEAGRDERATMLRRIAAEIRKLEAP